MTNYSWVISAGGTISAGGSATDDNVTVAWNTIGAQTVSVNYTNTFGCTIPTPTVYNVTVDPLPTPTLIGPASVCAGSTGNVYTTSAGYTNYNWTVSSGGTITFGGGTGNNIVTVTWNTAGAQTVSVNYTDGNGCSAAAPFVFDVTVNPLPAPTISGPSSVCVSTSDNLYTTDSGMSDYVWVVSTGGTITAGGGTGDNTVIVTWNTAGAQTVSVKYTNLSGCTNITPKVYNVTVNALPVPTITGQASVCVDFPIVYSTQANMTDYIWSVSSGGTITSGGLQPIIQLRLHGIQLVHKPLV